jgi:two-component system nitrate/nitrite response regulator NarL
VIVAEDNPGVLRQLVSLLEIEFEIVATAENGQTALECIRRCRPDVVVLDLEMPVLNGIEVTRELKEFAPSPGIVICSVETDQEIVDAAQHAGAACYVFKTRMSRDLVPAVKCAANGESFVSFS